MKDIFFAFTTLTIFAQMLWVGTHLSFADLVKLVTSPLVLARAALSILIVVPATAFALVAFVPFRPEVATGLAILAAAPGAPLTMRRSLAAGSDTQYVGAIQLVMAVTAVVFAPLTILLFGHFFDLTITRLASVDVALQVMRVTVLPVALGFGVQRLAPGFVARSEGRIRTISGYMFAALMVSAVLALLFVTELRNDVMIGWTGALALAMLAVTALGSGYALGESEKGKRAGLAILTVARNIGLALYIAELSPESLSSIPTILAYTVIGSLVAIPYSRWQKGASARGSGKSH